MSRSRNKCSIALRLVVATLVTTTASGCLHALGLARPSIGPRAAILSSNDSTVRAQDADSSSTQTKTINSSDRRSLEEIHLLGHVGAAVANGDVVPNAAIDQDTTPRSPLAESSPGMVPSHSISPTAPQVRLLTPQFSHAANTTNTQNQTPRSFPLNHAGPAPSALPAKPTLGFNTANVRSFLNRQSQNEMSQGTVLPEQPSQWKVLSSPKQLKLPIKNATQTVVRGGGETSTSSQLHSLPKTGSVTSKFVANSQSVPPDLDSDLSVEDAQIQATPTLSVEATPEPTMLERLKGFYEPATENAARRIWKRPFQKLSSPWAAVFGDREQNTDTPPNSVTQPPVAVAIDRPNHNAASVGDASELLLKLISATVDELKNWPRETNGKPAKFEEYQRRQQDLRLLYLIADQPGSAIQAVDELPAAEQNFWQELMLAIAEYRSKNEDSQQRLTNTTGQLRSAARLLAPLTSLQISRFEICSRVRSFGRIDPFQFNEFIPGQRILLYAEVENVASELTADGSHRTKFEAQLTLFEEGDTEARETVKLPDITDEASSERSDYYQSFELNLPSHLQSGEYLIRLRLRDRISGRTAESFAAFRVVRQAPSS